MEDGVSNSFFLNFYYERESKVTYICFLKKITFYRDRLKFQNVIGFTNQFVINF